MTDRGLAWGPHHNQARRPGDLATRREGTLRGDPIRGQAGWPFRPPRSVTSGGPVVTGSGSVGQLAEGSFSGRLLGRRIQNSTDPGFLGPWNSGSFGRLPRRAIGQLTDPAGGPVWVPAGRVVFSEKAEKPAVRHLVCPVRLDLSSFCPTDPCDLGVGLRDHVPDRSAAQVPAPTAPRPSRPARPGRTSTRSSQKRLTSGTSGTPGSYRELGTHIDLKSDP
jgi:hypothetical protein